MFLIIELYGALVSFFTNVTADLLFLSIEIYGALMSVSTNVTEDLLFLSICDDLMSFSITEVCRGQLFLVIKEVLAVDI